MPHKTRLKYFTAIFYALGFWRSLSCRMSKLFRVWQSNKCEVYFLLLNLSLAILVTQIPSLSSYFLGDVTCCNTPNTRSFKAFSTAVNFRVAPQLVTCGYPGVVVETSPRKESKVYLYWPSSRPCALSRIPFWPLNIHNSCRMRWEAEESVKERTGNVRNGEKRLKQH